MGVGFMLMESSSLYLVELWSPSDPGLGGSERRERGVVAWFNIHDPLGAVNPFDFDLTAVFGFAEVAATRWGFAASVYWEEHQRGELKVVG